MKQAERNLVLLLSDMKGFTARTSGQTREENAHMLALHDALLLPVVRGYRGRKVKGLGDALLAAFDSPTGAFEFQAARRSCIEIGRAHV